MGTHKTVILVAITFAVCWGLGAAPVGAQAGATTVDRIVRFTAADGTPLEAKLSIPSGATAPVPVVFVLHGAGPRNYDHALQYRDADGRVHVTRYYDYFAGQLAARGMAVFRMSKRGCSADPATGRPLVDRAVFSTATPSVLLDDYRRGLDAVRAESGVDPTRIVLFGSSEGTRIGARLAVASPEGIAGLVLTGYAADGSRETVEWQNAIGPWRNIRKLIPAATDEGLERAAYDAAVAERPTTGTQVPFAPFDADKDGRMTPAEVAQVVRPRLDAIVAAVRDGNDDLLWQAVANLTSAYLREDWDAPKTVETLLRFNGPIGIFHGELDGSTRVEGVRETEATFRAAGRTNLSARIYPGCDHDLNWTPASAADGGPQAFRDAFDFAARIAKR